MAALTIPSVTASSVVNVALDTLKMEKQALVFVNTRQSAEKTAEEIAKKLSSSQPLLALAQKALKSLSAPTKQCERLARCMQKGVAFHHSGLTSRQKELVEEGFRSGMIKIICCTPTLAAGVDLPAFRAIIRDVKRYGLRGLTWIPVLEYLQMAGRAGRPKFDTEGQAIIIASTESEKDEVMERYVNGVPEEIYSKLAVEPVLRTYLLSLIATRFVRSRADILAFFNRTFWAHQFRDMDKLERIIDKMLSLLEEWAFIVYRDGGDFVSADELDGSGKITATTVGKRVAELYLDPLTAHQLIVGMQKAGQRASPFGLLQLLSWSLEMRPMLRVRTREFEELQGALAEYEESLLTAEPSMFEELYAEFMDSVKTSLFFFDWADEQSEERLLEKYGIRPGEIRAKLDVMDWLLYASEELCKLLQLRSLLKDVSKLRFRVRYGVREELLPLLRLKNIGRMRARKLYNNRIRDLGDVKAADLTTLSQLIGRKIAADVKQQLGETTDVVKPTKRKGQLGMGRYGN